MNKWAVKVEDVVSKKVLSEMMDKRDFGLDFTDENEFKLFVNENYDISDSEIQEIWKLYKPSCEELDDSSQEW